MIWNGTEKRNRIVKIKKDSLGTERNGGNNMDMREFAKDVTRSEEAIRQANMAREMSLSRLEGQFSGSIEAYNGNKRNEFIITDWNAKVIYGTSNVVINIECLKDRKDNEFLNEESYSDEDFETMNRKLKRIIKEKTGQSVEIIVSPSYYGK